MIHPRGSLRLLFTALLLASLSLIPALGQKRGEATIPERKPAQPKRGEAVIEREEAPGPSAGKVNIKVVTPNEGALVLWVVPEATVTLTPLRNQQEGRPREYDLGSGNKLTIPLISPGQYKLSVKHADYDLFTETITIAKGAPTALLPGLVSKYGSINLVGAPAGAKVWLDGQELDPAKLKSAGEEITIPRVPVGKHRLKVSKEAHVDLEKDELEVFPGESTAVSAKLELATVTVTFESMPGAEVYIDNQKRGAIQPEGQVVITLLPGSYLARVVKDGYEATEAALELTLAERRPVKRVELTPIAESSEASLDFNLGMRQWYPAPSQWRIESGSFRGLRVSGDELALFKGATESRRFNVYFDFKLVLDLRFLNGKGAAWIIRAKDPQNYYLLELAAAQSENQRKQIYFSICRDGRCEVNKSFPLPAEIDQPRAALHLVVTAQGSKFQVTLDAGNGSNVIGNFADATFAYGGIGLRAVNGLEMLVQNLVIIPLPRVVTNPAR
jgi:hypothetical protein